MSSTKHSNPLIALVDCNNFYVSCERVFNPRLCGKPVVILSNNDGCVIARSNEAKGLGIPMGAPAFQYRDLFQRHNVFVFSSNYALYGDMSHRVMQTLAQFTPDIEIYSIDEAFLKLGAEEPEAFAQRIRQTVLQWTGIPVSIGISPTKTLAKVANRHAKKSQLGQGVFILTDPNLRKILLSELLVEDVWGIGRKISTTLKKYGIHTAWDLAQTEEAWIKKTFSIVTLRTALELRGISCLSMNEAPPDKKSITTSRSFSRPITEEQELTEALSTYVARAAEKLRDQGSLASFIEVFLETSRFKENGAYFAAIPITLPEPSNYTPLLIHHAKQGLHALFKKGLEYKKCGILLGGLVPSKAFQSDLFAKHKISIEKQRKLMLLIDKTNARYGTDTLKWAAQGLAQSWKMRQEHTSPRFTTRWSDLLSIRI